ncbi:unnamed protein product [Hermetia illucens]|uniref:Uncharacterized protein n=2 Tax=Hermetia illucens TaxID=343691 RepID=A0A7R8YYU4_HERIL|nr:unnamed protein product [Hermetia illucens]
MVNAVMDAIALLSSLATDLDLMLNDLRSSPNSRFIQPSSVIRSNQSVSIVTSANRSNQDHHHQQNYQHQCHQQHRQQRQDEQDHRPFGRHQQYFNLLPLPASKLPSVTSSTSSTVEKESNAGGNATSVGGTNIGSSSSSASGNANNSRSGITSSSSSQRPTAFLRDTTATTIQQNLLW